MAIDFIVGNNVVINRAFVEGILPTIEGITLQTTVSLGYIGANPSEVLETGSIVVSPTITLSFIRIRPQNTSNPTYQRNIGTVVYFPSDTALNNSFELSTAYLDDKQFVVALNSTGSTITKGQFVRQTGFDVTQQVPIIALADATTVANSAVLGVASADILTTELGSIIITGAFESLNTSGFSSVGAKAFLSDTPGAIAAAAGTEETIVGRVLSIDAVTGSISLVQSVGGGGGGAGGFFSDGAGLNAAIGKGTVAPTAAGENAMAHGDACVASGNNSFAQGDDCTASGDSSFSQGRGNTAAQPGTFIQGINNYDNRFDSGSANDGYSFIQGQNNNFYEGYRNNFVQGESNTIYGERNSEYGSHFIQGVANRTEYAKYGFMQGRNNYIKDSDSCFAQGQSVFCGMNYQRSWGSNRNRLGGAQSSRLIKHRTTTTGSSLTIADIFRRSDSGIARGVAYSIRAIIVGRNTTTPADNVVFTLEQALAYPIAGNTNFNLILNGSPTFTKEATGGASATAATISVSGDDVFIRVAGVSGQTYQWVCDVHFLEVTS